MPGRNIQSIMSEYDVIVVGSGLAGLTAGLFSARHGLSTLILESNIPGGHLISIEKIEDFPGFPDGIAGYDLCPTVQRQAADHGAEFERAESSSWKPKIVSGRLQSMNNRISPKPSSSPRVRRSKNSACLAKRN
jgi:2-polyprenyl-6-methoxyphenol hydroxylase-like FAD-dependent oxidoreductase